MYNGYIAFEMCTLLKIGMLVFTIFFNDDSHKNLSIMQSIEKLNNVNLKNSSFLF